jgi:hypothetical protein
MIICRLSDNQIIGFLLSFCEVSTHFAGANFIIKIGSLSIGVYPYVVFVPLGTILAPVWLARFLLIIKNA